MKDLIRQWLCQHKDTQWVSTKKTTVENLEHPEPKVTFIETWYMCNECGKFIKKKHYFNLYDKN